MFAAQCVVPFRAGSDAVGADQLAVGLQGEPIAMVHKETTRAGELVGLLGNHPNNELLAGEVGAWELEAVEVLAVIDVEDGGGGIIATARQCFEWFIGNAWFGYTGCIVVSGHQCPLCLASAYRQRWGCV